jgi:UDP-N-acetylmuramyl pentapeptide phosphotransferase/UDP-N-acetylglucosamine-1-phosphate transferase
MTEWPASSLASLIPFVSFLVTWIVLAVLIRTFSDRILDHPNERSLHQRPVPRTGGVGVTAGLAASVPFVSPAEWWPLWLGASVLAGISFLDDLIGLPIVARLVVHFAVAGACVVGLLLGQLGAGWAFGAMVAIVWMTNLYNFMDGMDGLAGGMALFGFGFLAIAAGIGGNISFALVNASIASAAGAFLLFNFQPARIFLGDAGSTTFGFLAVAIGLLGWRDGVWSIWFPLLVFSPFIVDATATLLRRGLQGERFWMAHRTHYYQRLILSGWSHRKTALVEYGLMLFCGISALAFQWAPGGIRLVIVGLLALGFIGLAQAVSRIEQRVSGKRVFD